MFSRLISSPTQLADTALWHIDYRHTLMGRTDNMQATHHHSHQHAGSNKNTLYIRKYVAKEVECKLEYKHIYIYILK